LHTISSTLRIRATLILVDVAVSIERDETVLPLLEALWEELRSHHADLPAGENDYDALPAADLVERVVQHMALAGAPAEVRCRSTHCSTVGMLSDLRNLLTPCRRPVRHHQSGSSL
jgi:hypothetical protein